MRDPDAALPGWGSRVSWWPRTLSLRRDLALPLVLLAVQLISAATIEGGWHLFVRRAPSACGLGAARSRPGGPGRAAPPSGLVLSVTFATTPVAPSGTGLTHVSFIVAFFVSATAGKRYPAWLALVLTFVWTISLARSFTAMRGSGKRRAGARWVAAGGGDRGRGDRIRAERVAATEPPVSSISAASRVRSGCGSPGTCTT